MVTNLKSSQNRKGLVIVNTGNGKGKTTAALGVLLRSWGRGLHICVIQFIKPEESNTGEYLAATNLSIEWHRCGDGFTWLSNDENESANFARKGWTLAQEKIKSGAYDLIVLDEFTYPLNFHWIDTAEVVNWLTINRPEYTHLIITGRDAPSEIIDYADLVTEMKLIKHPFTRGIKGQLGIEF
jgi:cob(I)alamin adenosyltransferase